MPFEGTKILELNQHEKSDKTPFIIYADLECSIETTDGYKNNPEYSFTTKLINIFHQLFQCLHYRNLKA